MEDYDGQLELLRAEKIQLQTQMNKIDNDIKVLERKKECVKGIDIVKDIIAKAKPDIKYPFHPQPYLISDKSLEDLFDPDATLHEPIEGLILKHFTLESYQVTYKVITSECSPLRVREYEGSWEIDYVNLDDAKDYNLTFYTQLYDEGYSNFSENIYSMDHNEDLENSRGLGKIYVDALVLTLKNEI